MRVLAGAKVAPRAHVRRGTGIRRAASDLKSAAPAAHLASLRRVRGRAAVGRVHVTAAATTLRGVALGVMRPLVVIPLGRVVTLGLRLMTRRSEVVRPRVWHHGALLVILPHVPQIRREVTHVIAHGRAAAAPAPRVIVRRLALLAHLPLRNLSLLAFFSLSLFANLLLKRGLVLSLFARDCRALLLGEGVGPAALWGRRAAHAGEAHAAALLLMLRGTALVIPAAVVVRDRPVRHRSLLLDVIHRGIMRLPVLTLLLLLRRRRLRVVVVKVGLAPAHVPLPSTAASVVPAIAHVVDGVAERLRVVLGGSIPRLVLALLALAFGNLRL
mmetsp:Transcript_7136/g.19523  ORF Transcript_7136/g.19523 Transcript_7136/m.19523 type:complete len:328 (-) Transcript_7136:738-1721(-)